MSKITFNDYWDFFFTWSDLDFKKNYRQIKSKYWKDYEKYCKHIGQEVIT